ncbi:MAG: DUF4252 domain-containing protein [Haliscomenobacter sp.]|nr:DUF4252 domain-containing protein [Haliscomenobacter sp.]MBK8655575.1 DUF4252 domain-containing protein [Haliscomenobacter sp.]
MRTLLLLCCLSALLPGPLAAQTSAKAFYRDHKREEGVFNFKLPGWLVWFAGGIAYNSVRDPDLREALWLGKKLGNLRMMHSENGNGLSPQSVSSLVDGMYASHYEDLILVREGDTRVHFLVKDKREKLKDLVLLIHEEDGFTLFSMKSRLKIDDISRLIEHFILEDPKNPEEPGKKKILSSKRKVLIPQA